MGGLTLPVLRTDRLRLEPVTQAHLELFGPLNGDPAVMAFILGRPATFAETEAEWSNRLATRHDAARGLGHWAGFVDGGLVGWWSASSFTADRSVAGLGYRLVRTAWGEGYATEGARAMLDQAFACPEVQRVVASTMAAHAASRAVLTKLGMRHTDTWVPQRDSRVTGWEQGEVGYELTRAAYAAQP